MQSSLSRFNFILLSLLISTFSNAADTPNEMPTSDLDYGEMYVIQKHEAAIKRWETAVSYSFGFSNPYINSHGFNLSFNRQLSEFFLIGVSGSYFVNSNSNLTSELQTNLSSQGVTSFIYKPQSNSYLTFTTIPLSGILNWFGKKSMNFDLPIGIGAGIATYYGYTPITPSLRVFVTPKLMFTETIGATAGISSSWDRFSSGDWHNRVETIFGALVRF